MLPTDGVQKQPGSVSSLSVAAEEVEGEYEELPPCRGRSK